MKKKLEEFIINNSKLELLEDRLSQFNIFKVLKLEGFEIRHSNMLAFLFNPSEGHGLRDYFLKKYLITVLADTETDFSPVQIDSWDLNDSIVQREHQNIDILISSESNSFVCCIENKVYSTESEGQLNKYRSIVNKEFKNYKHKLFIFLSPTGLTPSDEDNWVISRYEQIGELLEYTLNNKENLLGDEQKIFLEHYKTIIRRYYMESSEEKELAREIYKSHKEAIDFIFANIKNERNELFEKISESIANNPDLVSVYSTSSLLRFTTKSIDQMLPHNSNGEWGKFITHVFVFELQNNPDSVVLTFIMGPADQEYREKCFGFLKQGFTDTYYKKKCSLSSKWNFLYRKDIISKNEYAEMDFETKVDAINRALSFSTNPDLAGINQYFEDNATSFQE